MEENDVIRSLAALAHGLRLQVFRLLVVAGPTGLTPGAITEQVGVPGATLSFHLKELMNARLITQEREGRHLIYRAAFEHMRDLLGFLTANCCQGEACFENAATATTVCAC
ncbi:putative transcriptional regulator, ArsR family protein [Cupriavidus basilensis OR16]|uniref:Putative transcriptional regulator, ArsR family protein n=1 Tax=Cupriavidus basilensis OR16 TaxID=1127483 RepID=H1SDC5_9BURK|nr:metalloregulator ArsR/SmtB family transcription factor [Cupriavidus basilensis]EHP39494.1 putative transcriptional regulator, ArsR family protein [Cupriavidus basilensis OR16]